MNLAQQIGIYWYIGLHIELLVVYYSKEYIEN